MLSTFLLSARTRHLCCSSFCTLYSVSHTETTCVGRSSIFGHPSFFFFCLSKSMHDPLTRGLFPHTLPCLLIPWVLLNMSNSSSAQLLLLTKVTLVIQYKILIHFVGCKWAFHSLSLHKALELVSCSHECLPVVQSITRHKETIPVPYSPSLALGTITMNWSIDLRVGSENNLQLLACFFELIVNSVS